MKKIQIFSFFTCMEKDDHIETKPKSKHRKLESSNDTKQNDDKIDINIDSEMIFNTKLTDINFDCQEAVFQFLSLSDLLNVANTDERFLEAVRIVYSRLYKTKTVRINLNAMTSSFATHNIKSDCIEVYDRNFISRLLSTFGDRIKKLSISMKTSSNRFISFFDIQAQINQFCASSLVELSIQNCEHFPSEAYIQPFTELRCLSMQNCKIPFKTDEFSRFFPCLNRFELVGNTVINPDFIEQNFCGLEHLVLECDPDNGFSSQNILVALCLNQQLSSLHLTPRLGWKFLRSINESSPGLRNLQLAISSYEFISGGSINFKNVEKLTLTVDRDPFKDSMSLKFDQLKELEVRVDDGGGNGVINFIVENGAKLNKLTIVAPSWNTIELSDLDITTIGENLHLSELTLQRCCISNHAASDIMNNSKELRKFQFEQMDPKKKLILNIKNDDWKWTCVGGSVYCERR